MNVTQCILVGCGGTGSILLEPLARLLAHHANAEGSSLWLIDGDAFEEKNAARQMGCQPGAAKATVAQTRARGILPSSYAIVDFVDGAKLMEYLPTPGPEGPHLVVILAVDNHATRKALIESLRGYACASLLVLSPGNDLDKGQVKAWARVADRSITPCPLSVDSDGVALEPELLNPADKIPMQADCVQAAAESTPQLITANMMSAACTLALVQRWLDRPDGEMPYETGFYVQSFGKVKVYSQ